jgi:hypothetical protein
VRFVIIDTGIDSGPAVIRDTLDEVKQYIRDDLQDNDPPFEDWVGLEHDLSQLTGYYTQCVHGHSTWKASYYVAPLDEREKQQ